VLRELDLRRRTAWRLGRPQLLARVYAPGSDLLRLDQGLLRDYLRRGLRVADVSLRFTSVRFESRRLDAAALLVVDRLRRAVAVDARNHRRALPLDQPTRHRIELRLFGDRWRIAQITLA